MALSQSGSPVVLALGVLLTVALIAGLVAQVLRLPRVTAYLLAGLVMGPNTYAILPAWLRARVPGIPAEYFEPLEPLGELAMALVLFNIGCQLPLDRFRKMMRRVLRLSAGELGLTFVLVSTGMLLLPLGASWISWKVALLFGALALATAPATTILVLKENESEGPITAYATAMVALNNLAAVVLFEILYRTIHFYEGRGETDVLQEFGQFAIDLAGSTAMGFTMGLLTSYACGIFSQGRWLVMFVAAATLLLGLCGLWNVPYLLAFLAMGATVANASDRASNVVVELDRITGLLCVIFFVIHGAELDVHALYVSGAVGMAYIVLRSLGKYFGAYFAADAHHDGPQVKQWLGATLLAQAGAAIALSAIAAEGLGETGRQLQSI
ncbi:MAG: cation:proton antiporter, partial [Planctomycetota bacterium]|nr:cation:proton antiporter [Planctomycetota bacterium]